MAPVFISFIHEEIEWATAVQAFISLMLGEGAEPFLSSDRFQIFAGEKWLDRIMEELEGAKVVILMLSEKSVQRPWVNFEAGAAWTRNIVTIPVCFGGLEKADLPKPYSSLQAIDLELSEDQEYLARSVAHHVGIPEPIITIYGLGAISALGGPGAEKTVRRQEAARDLLRKNLPNCDGSLGARPVSAALSVYAVVNYYAWNTMLDAVKRHTTSPSKNWEYSVGCDDPSNWFQISTAPVLSGLRSPVAKSSLISERSTASLASTQDQ